MKQVIFKRNSDGTHGQKLGSYEGAKDDSSAARPHDQAWPLAEHFELPEGMDENCVLPVLIEEVAAVPGQPEKWTKEGEEDVYEDPQDVSWTHVPAVEEVAGVPAHYELQEDAGLIAARDAYAALAPKRAAESAIEKAMTFGNQVMKEFAGENVLLGITQAGMTGTVRKNMAEVIMALTTGSLYDAIAEAKAIPLEDKDATFITDARLLAFVNKIEAYLGITLSQSL